MNIKKHLYYPFIIFSVPLGVVCMLLDTFLSLVKVLLRIILNLCGRGEWWICNCHKDAKQPLNPFNETFKEIWNEEFNL